MTRPLGYPPGARVVIRFGSFGTQVAEVVRLLPPAGLRVVVRKYRAKSHRWTQATIADTDILRHATGAELRPWSPAALEFAARLEARRAARKAAPNLGAAFVLANGGKLPKGAA